MNSNINNKPLQCPVIFIKANTDSIVHAANTVIQHLLCLKMKFLLVAETANFIGNDSAEVLNDQNKAQADCVIVIGGDGSLLSAGNNLALNNLPIIGVNLGTVGFLTDINPNDLKAITEILAGKYKLETRSFIAASVNQQHEYLALNDVVLSRHAARLLNFDLFINNEFVCSQRADGLIIATPTGSTAYALSAGGPILHPQLDALAIVPLCPHKLSSRPIVISSDNIIDVYLFKTKSQQDAIISCDGRSLDLSDIKQLTIKQCEQVITLIHPVSYNYFCALKSKLHWENNPAN